MSPWASSGRFETLGASHLAVWGLFVVGVVLMVLLGRRVRGTERAVAVSRLLALSIPALLVPLQVVDLLPGNYDVRPPCRCSSATWPGRSRRRALDGPPVPVALVYYWGLCSPQALLTPTLGADFPDPRFLAFWGMHLMIVWAAVYLGTGPASHVARLRQHRGHHAGLAGVVRVLAGTNYGYVNAKPGTATILDYLGPWPWYVAVEIALVAIVWALMTLPWQSGHRADREAVRTR